MSEFWIYLRDMYNSDPSTYENMFIYKSTHLLIQQIFSECPLCAGPYLKFC